MSISEVVQKVVESGKSIKIKDAFCCDSDIEKDLFVKAISEAIETGCAKHILSFKNGDRVCVFRFFVRAVTEISLLLQHSTYTSKREGDFEYVDFTSSFDSNAFPKNTSSIEFLRKMFMSIIEEWGIADMKIDVSNTLGVFKAEIEGLEKEAKRQKEASSSAIDSAIVGLHNGLERLMEKIVESKGE